MQKITTTNRGGATSRHVGGALSETDIQNRIRAVLSEYGIVLRLNVGEFTTKDGRHISSGLPAGTPDLLFIGQSRIAFIEVKRPSGRPSKAQVNFIQAIRKLGHRAGIARSVDDAEAIINYTGDPEKMEPCE